MLVEPFALRGCNFNKGYVLHQNASVWLKLILAAKYQRRRESTLGIVQTSLSSVLFNETFLFFLFWLGFKNILSIRYK